MIYRFRNNDLLIARHQLENVLYYVIEDPTSGVVHRLYEHEFQVAQLLDGRRSVEKVAKLAQKKLGLNTEAVDVEHFVTQLSALGFVESVA